MSQNRVRRGTRSTLNSTGVARIGSPCRVSFVVTSRNDNHGGHMLERFAIFADGLLEQANRHGLTGELIVVEWNPLPGPRLHEVLKLRHTSDSFPVRFIEAPHQAHQLIRNSDTIPLFQMIAKNVGIRRAQGEFVIATNPDVLFSDSLISFLAAGDLRADTLYRLDRHDVEADVPADAGIADQLSWCSQHVLRIHGRAGTFEPRKKRRFPSWRYLRALGLLGYQAAQESLRAALASCGQVVDGWRSELLRLRGWHPKFRRVRHWRPWQIRKTLGAFERACAWGDRVLLRVCRVLLPSRLMRAIDRASVAYGPHRLRHALWLGAKRAFGPPRVHTNGCGDFTLIARQHWLRLRGYPELPLWSMHIDSFLCFMAVAAGLREEILPPPSLMFHMEHERSWVVMTPEDRLRTFALRPWIDIGLLGDLWEDAYTERRPVLFNDERWGLADWDLTEVLLLSGDKHVIKSGSPLVPVREE